jgi:hypothetical protein
MRLLGGMPEPPRAQRHVGLHATPGIAVRVARSQTLHAVRLKDVARGETRQPLLGSKRPDVTSGDGVRDQLAFSLLDQLEALRRSPDLLWSCIAHSGLTL